MPAKSKYYIGTSGWTYSDWRGAFYPEDLPQKKWFSYYAQHFSVVKINATFYRFFKPEVYKKWREQAPNNFKYTLKVPRLITHYKRLINCDDTIKQFVETASLLEDKLGLMLLQLPPSMKYEPELLARTINKFPNPKQLVVEFRNKFWYTPEVKDLLTELGCVFCIADSPITKMQPWVTSEIAYIRLHGRTKWFDYNYSHQQLRKIHEFILQLDGAKKIYIFFNNDYYTYAIKNAQYLEKLLKL